VSVFISSHAEFPTVFCHFLISQIDSSFSEFSDQFFTSQKMAKNLYQLTVQIAAYMCIFVFVDFEAFSVQKWSQKNVPIY
jgi:hypothetical protein